MRNLLRLGLILGIVLATTTVLHATNISFYGMASGTQITTQYASEGVTFTTENPTWAPAIADSEEWWGCTPDESECGVGLTNTATGDYPTALDLDILFPNGASNVSFTFDNWGEGNGSNYTAYSGATVVASGALDEGAYVDNFGLVTVPGSGITEIQISNACGYDCWEFGVGELTTAEPTTLTLLGAGLLGLCGLVRRKRSN
jgi:hypothetical protein